MKITTSLLPRFGIRLCVVCGLGIDVDSPHDVKEATFSERRLGVVITYHYFSHSHHTDSAIEKAVREAQESR